MAKFQKNNGRNAKGRYPSKGGKSKRNFDKDRRDEDRRGDDKGEDVKSLNDPAWYARYPELLVAAGSFPYPNRPGMKVYLGDGTGYQYKIPGIMTLDWIPSVGKSTQPTDPASILGAEIYARVRKVYSGTLRADAPDYILYIMALDSVYAYIAWLKRLYRTLNAYTPDNYILPDVVLGAMGLVKGEIDTLRANKMDLWSAINSLVLMSRRFTCPGSLDIINRHYWMSDNLYTDDASINSQFYLFNPRGYYQYGTVEDSNKQQVPALLFKSAPGHGVSFTVSNLYKFGREMIDALATWDDSYTINGYLQRAYEGDPLFMVEEIPQEEMLVPQYVPEVLTQIENSRGIPGAEYIDFDSTTPSINLTISQDVPTNSILFNPVYNFEPTGVAAEVASVLTEMNHFISMRTPNATALDNVIASRLQASFDATPISNGYKITIKGATEIPLGWRFVESVPTLTAQRWTDYIPIVVNTRLASTATIDDYKALMTTMKDYLRLEAFDWHPIFYVTDNGLSEFYPVGDVHNVTVVTKDQMDKLNRVCLFSEFNSFSMM